MKKTKVTLTSKVDREQIEALRAQVKAFANVQKELYHLRSSLDLLRERYEALRESFWESEHKIQKQHETIVFAKKLLNDLAARHVGFTFKGFSLTVLLAPRSLLDAIKRFRLTGEMTIAPLLPEKKVVSPGAPQITSEASDTIYDDYRASGYSIDVPLREQPLAPAPGSGKPVPLQIASEAKVELDGVVARQWERSKATGGVTS